MSVKNKKPNDLSLNRLNEIKKLGFLKSIKPTKNAPLTSAQKTKIREQYKKLAPVINSPKSEFQKISIAKYNKEDKKIFKNSGYLIVDDKIFIPTEGQEKVSIRKEYRNDKTSGLEKSIVIKRSNKNGRKTIEEYLGSNIQKLAWQERLEKEYKNAKIKNGSFFGVKVYNNGIFRREIFDNINTAFKYLENDFTPKHGDSKDKLLDNMHIVKITVKDISDMGLGKSQKEKNQKSYVSKKMRKNLKGRVKIK